MSTTHKQFKMADVMDKGMKQRVVTGLVATKKVSVT
jgi:hypothetical protein